MVDRSGRDDGNDSDQELTECIARARRRSSAILDRLRSPSPFDASNDDDGGDAGDTAVENDENDNATTVCGGKR